MTSHADPPGQPHQMRVVQFGVAALCTMWIRSRPHTRNPPGAVSERKERVQHDSINTVIAAVNRSYPNIRRPNSRWTPPEPTKLTGPGEANVTYATARQRSPAARKSPLYQVFLSAPSRTRTDTVRILSPLPLPIGLWGLAVQSIL